MPLPRTPRPPRGWLLLLAVWCAAVGVWASSPAGRPEQLASFSTSAVAAALTGQTAAQQPRSTSPAAPRPLRPAHPLPASLPVRPRVPFSAAPAAGGWSARLLLPACVGFLTASLSVARRALRRSAAALLAPLDSEPLTEAPAWRCVAVRSEPEDLAGVVNLKGVRIPPGSLSKLLDVLGEHNSITSLNLSDTELSSEDVNVLVEWLPSASTLTELDLSGVSLGVDDLQRLGQWIPESSTTRLRLARTGMGIGAVFLSDALAARPNLLALDLSINSCLSENAPALVDSLVLNSGLQSLELADATLAEEDMGKIIGWLPATSSFETLDLSGNAVGVDDVQNLSQWLADNSTLRTLRLARIGLSLGTVFLAEALKANSQLKELDISENPLDESDLADLIDALKENTGLRSLNLAGLSIEDSHVEALVECLAANRTLTHVDLGFASNTHLEDLLHWNKVVFEVDAALSGAD
eukprot:EG_transcript_8848